MGIGCIKYLEYLSVVDYVGIYKAPSLVLRRKAKRAYANLKDTNPSVSNSTTKPATKTDDTWKLVSNEIKTAWDNLKGAWDFGKGQQTNHSRLLVAQCFSFGVPVSSVAKQLQEQQSIVKGLDWDGKKDADYTMHYTWLCTEFIIVGRKASLTQNRFFCKMMEHSCTGNQYPINEDSFKNQPLTSSLRRVSLYILVFMVSCNYLI